MKKVFSGMFLCLEFCLPFVTHAQADKVRIIPFNAESWSFEPGRVEFLPAAPPVDGVRPHGPAMKIIGRGTVVAKNIDFSDGVIDFDIQPIDSNFASFYFRRQDAMEAESFYFRTSWASGKPDVMEGVQYTPVIKGVNAWNLLPHYQGNASFRQENWNHVRIQIAGKQMLIFVNSEIRPTLTIPRLEGNTTHGSFAFEGQMVVAHLTVRATIPVASGWLAGPDGYDPTDNDPRYIRHWQVSQPDTIATGIDFGKNMLPGKQTAWTPIDAERRGLVNLTRMFGRSSPRRIVWLKTTLQSGKEWNYKLRLGFTNDVWVFLNGKYLYTDKNYYDEPSMKIPRARVSIENCSFNLPLKAGANELLIGVANDFFGWGIVGRLDENNGLMMESGAGSR